MTPTLGLRAIPWAFIDHAVMKMWIWRTDHFEAKVTADVNSFSWEIVDLVRDPDGLFLTEGRARDFNDAERDVREAVGKSYPPKYGYGAYAGDLATTFTIATGERIDFAKHAGMRTLVTVRMPAGASQTYVGTVRPVHYQVHLTPDSGQTVAIQPAHITKVTGEGGGQQGRVDESYTGMGRVYRGVPVRGCSGTVGFLPNTIDHTGAECPVHEDHRFRY